MTSAHPLIALCCAGLIAGCGTLLAPASASVQRGQVIFAKECSVCHGRAGDGAGSASLGLGAPPPDLTGLTARNDGVFPRAFVQRFVLGQIEKEHPDAAMPEFGTVGLAHVYPDGSRAGEVSGADMAALLDYIESLQK